MFFRLLGQVEFTVRGSRVDLGPQRHRGVLAVLLLSPRRVVPAATLIDRVWGESAPVAVRNTLYSYVTRLRRVLASGCPAGSPALLVSRNGGYVLDVEPDLVDLHRFRALLNRAGQFTGDDESFTRLSGEALRLWQDDPLANVSGDWFASQREALRMERLGALARHFDASERLGQSAVLIPDLASALEDNPLAEPIALRLINALGRNGRRAEALACFARVRARIAEELGTEPGNELQNLHIRLLQENSESLAPARNTGEPRTWAASGPSATLTNLPGTAADFTGRAAEMDWLLANATRTTQGTPAIVAINGLAGVGKTTLALHAAHRLLEEYPDAHLFVDLCGHSTGRDVLSTEEALDMLLRCIGVPAAEVPIRFDERLALWRTKLHRRRTLVVLDNAASVEQLQPLLPSSGNSLVLVTSRQRLIGLAGAHALSLDPLTPADAASLFERIAGHDRVRGQADAVAEVLALCGYLPLALRIAAARLQHRPTWTVAHLLARLRDQATPLAELADGNRGVAASIHLSYAQLTPDHRWTFRLTGLMPGSDFSAYACAAMANQQVRDARNLLEDLVDANLLQQHCPDRYRAHDLVRDYARHLAATEETADSNRHAIGRLLDFYRRGAYVANGHITSRPAPFSLPDDDAAPAVPGVDDRPAALAWLEQERINLVAAVRLAATASWTVHAWQIASRLWYFLNIRGYNDDWISTQRIAIEAATSSGDQNAESLARYSLGIAYRVSGQYPESIAELRHVFELGQLIGDQRRQADALNSLGCAYSHGTEYAKASDSLHQAADLYHRIGDRDGETMAIGNLGIVALRANDHAAAEELCQTTIDRTLHSGAHHVRADAMIVLAEVRHHMGRPHDALRLYQQAAELAREIGNLGFEARAVNGIARLTGAAGDLTKAVDGHTQALTQLQRLGDRVGQVEVHLGLGDTYRAHTAIPKAAQHYRQALTLAQQIGNRHCEVQALARLSAINAPLPRNSAGKRSTATSGR